MFMSFVCVGVMLCSSFGLCLVYVCLGQCWKLFGNVTMTLFGMGIDDFSQFAQDRPKAFTGNVIWGNSPLTVVCKPVANSNILMDVRRC